MKYDPYEMLADAIILRAKDDLVSSVYNRDQLEYDEVSNFFESKWIRVLTTCDGPYILRKIKEGLYDGSIEPQSHIVSPEIRRLKKTNASLIHEYVKSNLVDLDSQHYLRRGKNLRAHYIYNSAGYNKLLIKSKEKRDNGN